MLTIKSRFINFKNRNGEAYTAEDLNSLYEALILPDIVTFPKNKNRNFGYGFTQAIADKVYEKLTLDKDAKILIINDISLQVYNKLTNEGYKRENIYLAFGKWNKKAEPEDNDAVYNIMKDYIKYNFADELNIIKLKEIFTMGIKIDGIIANPPYGAIGANITKKIIDTVDFVEYINLLPANDYKKNSTKDLFNYQSDMECVTKTNTTAEDKKFTDAAVTTHVAMIHKTKANNMTLDEFERSNYIDAQLDKYFAENSKRSHYAIDAMPATGLTAKNAGAWDITKTFIIGMRDMNHKHLPYSKKADSYKWNVEESLTMEYLLTERTDKKNHQLFISNCNFNSIIEKQNFVKFVYDNFKFMSKVFTALNCDGTVHSIAFPKVDWTRSWTVEEILADYGYAQDEIQAVMDDLKNFKGMED